MTGNILQDYLTDILYDLASVQQNTKFHPEGNALFHSLQVFDLCYRECDEPMLWTAALFHDVGKAVDGPKHAIIGASMLEGIFHKDILWLIKHHLDLLISPRKTIQRYRAQDSLRQLQLLRQYDLKGRNPYASVPTVEQAVAAIMNVYSMVRA